MDKFQGKIVFLNDKGYGFIEVSGYDKSVFFHAKDLRHVTFDQIRKDDQVSLDEIIKTEKGYNAKNVYLIS